MEHELFADRVLESEAFAAALAAHRRRLDDVVGDEDDTQGRNLLVFHGRGGVGKSKLSELLEEWVNGSIAEREHWGPPPSIHVAVTARIDLHGSYGHIDPAAEFARIRIALSSLKRRWPLFDVAFAAYWAASHPGQSLPLLEEEGDAEIAPAAIELLSALSEDIGSPSSLATITVQAMRKMLGHTSERLRARGRVDVPPGYDRLFERCTVEPSPEDPALDVLGMLAELLSYELDQIQGPVPMVVVFIDTFERLTLDERRAGENALNRVIRAMSNVLFVVTGRNRLTWWQLEGPALPFRGPSDWPLLAPDVVEEPRQHALEHLSSKDRRVLIDLLWHRFALPDDADARAAIAEASGGLPEYIRLAMHAAATNHRQGLPINVDLVAGRFDDLVKLLLVDLPEDEQRAVRASALFLHADPVLIASAADVSVGAAERALSSALFTLRVVGDATAPVLHDEVRRAVRNASRSMSGGWAEDDWNAAGTRALAAIRERHTIARTAYRDLAEVDPVAACVPGRNLLWLTGQAIAVVTETDADIGAALKRSNPNWVAEAMTNGPSYGGLRPFVPAAARTEFGRELLDFLRAKSAELSRADKIVVLRALFRGSRTLHWIAGRHLAYVLRDGGAWDEAMEVFDVMLAADPESVLVRRQRVITLIQGRRFPAANSAIPEAAEESRAYLSASVARSHGHLDVYIDAADKRLAILRSSDKSVKDTIELQGSRLRMAVFRGRASRTEIDEVAALAEATGHDLCRRDVMLATVLLDGSDTALHDLEIADRARNDGLIGARTAWAKVALAYLSQQAQSIALIRDEILDSPQARGSGWIGSEMGLEAAGVQVPDPLTEWMEPRDAVVARWKGHWSAWATRVREANLSH